jgi:hypothetical protein
LLVSRPLGFRLSGQLVPKRRRRALDFSSGFHFRFRPQARRPVPKVLCCLHRNVVIFAQVFVSACVALGDAPPARSRFVSALGLDSPPQHRWFFFPLPLTGFPLLGRSSCLLRIPASPSIDSGKSDGARLDFTAASGDYLPLEYRRYLFFGSSELGLAPPPARFQPYGVACAPPRVRVP